MRPLGFAYLALVIDVFSRRILGWALTTHMRTALPLEALEMAIWTRQAHGRMDEGRGDGTKPRSLRAREGSPPDQSIREAGQVKLGLSYTPWRPANQR